VTASFDVRKLGTGNAYEVLEYDSAVVEALHLFPTASQPHITAAAADGPADSTTRGTVRSSMFSYSTRSYNTCHIRSCSVPG
jgi:hypothetical protein